MPARFVFPDPSAGLIAPEEAPGFIAPLDGVRAACWQALAAMPPGWALLTGLPGMGRSRLAREVARLRRADWDGFLLSPLGSPGLGSWQPPRPALLILDDAAPDQAVAAITALFDRPEKQRLRRPVRLLVVLPDIPDALRMVPAAVNGQTVWQSALPDFTGLVAQLGPDAALTCRDIRLLACTIDLPRMRWQDAHVERFRAATDGNPLLVQLAFDWLRSGGRLDGMDRTALLDEAVRALCARLDAASIGTDDHLNALATATLCGPAGARSGPPCLAFDKPDFPAEALQSVFGPVASGRLPAVAPSLVGAQLLRHVLRRDPAAAPRIATAAWRAEPAIMPAEARHVLARTDLLADAVAATMGLESDLDEVACALALARAAVQVPRLAWDAGEGGDGRVALSRAMAAVQALPPSRAAAALGQFAALLEIPNAIAVARGDAGFALFRAAALRALDAPIRYWQHAEHARAAAEALATLLEGVIRWGLDEAATPGLDLPATIIRTLDGMAPIDPWAACWDNLARILDQRGASLPGLAASVFSALSKCGGRHLSEQQAALAIRLRLQAVALRDTPDVLANAAALLLPSDRPDRLLAREAAQAWRLVAYARARIHDLPGSAEAVRQVQALTTPYAEERSFAVEHVRALKCLAYLHGTKHEPERCRAAARAVEGLVCGGFGELRDFALLCAESWTYAVEACSRTGNLDGAMAAAERVEGLALLHENDRDFALSRLRAWTDIAYLHAARHDLDRCAETVDRIGMIAQHHAGERVFMSEHAMALKQLCLAAAAQNDRGLVERTAGQIAHLVDAGYRGQASFELEHAQAYACLAFVRAREDDAAGAIEAAERVDSIANFVSGGQRQDFLRECVGAWRAVAFAGRHDRPVWHEAVRHIAVHTTSELATDPAFRSALADVMAFEPVDQAADIV